MKKSYDHIELSYQSIECFANDGKLDAAELGKLMAIAERDGNIDADEARVLNNIISRIRPEEIDAAMEARLEEVRKKLAEAASDF